MMFIHVNAEVSIVGAKLRIKLLEALLLRSSRVGLLRFEGIQGAEYPRSIRTALAAQRNQRLCLAQ